MMINHVLRLNGVSRLKSWNFASMLGLANMSGVGLDTTSRNAGLFQHQMHTKHTDLEVPRMCWLFSACV
jgi:hypothetical protein